MYCGCCGERLDNEFVLICPSCKGRTKNDRKYCTKCGERRVAKSKNGCAFCGNSYDMIEKKNKNSNRNTGDIFRKIFVVVFLIGMIITIYLDAVTKVGMVDTKTGQYISAAQLHASVPIQIIGVILVGMAFFKNIKSKK
ncbi:MAG: hypothetical protein ACRDDY_09430 [Clostridium sp.]|uniref:hypothetical protein n=1 Tax=Clostridium sp. TaxID=1506 RepID=UPI003EE6378C